MAILTELSSYLLASNAENVLLAFQRDNNKRRGDEEC